MRLDQRTVILLVISLVVIVAVLVVSNTANAPGESLTPTVVSGTVFGTVDKTTINGISITNNETGATTVLAKDAGGAWSITEATNSTDRAVDQNAVSTALDTFTALSSSESFAADNLADYGLDAPKYTMIMTAADGSTYTIQIGNKAPANPRYYALVNIVTTAETTAEATAEAGGAANTVYVVQQSQTDNLANLITTPPYVPPPTATVTFTPTLNPMSEVEIATATAAFNQTATVQAELTAEALAEATGEATAEATSETTEAAAPQATEEATQEATEEATVEATAEATQEPTEVAQAETTEEATEAVVSEATEEATTEATVETTPTATRTPRPPTATPTPTETPTPTQTPEPLPTSIALDSEARYADLTQGVSDEGFPQLGEADAPVSITLFSSFDCPACRQFHLEVFINLVDRVRAGDVRVTFVPLYGKGNIANGENAAKAAVCAAQQDGFWRLSDTLFERQGTLRNQAFTSAALGAAVSDLGIDRDQWDTCMSGSAPDDVLAAASDAADAQSVTTVPVVLVNGEAVDADLDSINAAIDAALQAAPEGTAEATPGS